MRLESATLLWDASEAAKAVRKIIGMRNVIAHEYGDID